jgi:hypothetical protein
VLHTLINSTTESTISINKSTPTVLTFLKVMHRKVDMFKIHNKLLSDELSLLQHQHSNFTFLQHYPLFGVPIDSEQQGIEYVPVMNQIKEFDVDDENELHGDTRIRQVDIQVNNELKKNEDELDKVTEKTDNDSMTNTAKDKLKDDAAKIVRPWEELQLKRN